MKRLYFLHRLEVPPWHLLFHSDTEGRFPCRKRLRQTRRSTILPDYRKIILRIVCGSENFLYLCSIEHHDVKPQGKQTVKELISQNQGVEKTELADKAEVRTFDHIAKQYGVDYAIKKGVSPEGKQRYMLFFKARDRSAIDQAMSAYAASYMKKHRRAHPPIEQVVDPLKEMLPGRKKDRVRDKGMQR